MPLTRAFISFDYDHDYNLYAALVGQSNMPDSPFTIANWSIKEASSNWKADARRRIRHCDVVIVLCGWHTASAHGVSTEVQIAQEESIDYFLLEGHPSGSCQRPVAAKTADKMYTWDWPNLKLLVAGNR